MPLEARDFFVGFGPGGNTGLVVSDESANSRHMNFRLRLVEVPTGTELAELYTNDGALESWSGSPDGRVWLFRSGISWFKVDALHRNVTPLNDVPEMTTGITADGRYCFFNSNPVDGCKSMIWDLERNQVYRHLANRCWPEGVDIQGNQVVMSWREDRLHVSLNDPKSLDERAHYWIDQDLLVRAPNSQLNDEPRVIRDIVMMLNEERLRVFDAASLKLRFQIPEPVDYAVLSPDALILMAARWSRETPLECWLKHIGLSAIVPKNKDLAIRLFSTETGAELYPNLMVPKGDMQGLLWLPGQLAAAVKSHDTRGGLQIWDIPPRKSLTWFAVGAALLALPIALLAWRRISNLRAA